MPTNRILGSVASTAEHSLAPHATAQRPRSEAEWEGRCASGASVGSAELQFSADHQHLVADLEQPEERFDQRQGKFHEGFRAEQFSQVEFIRKR
jgi:hypothetical protein